jgi:flagellar biosynthesis protein
MATGPRDRRKLAVALRYAPPADRAPRLVAKAQGPIAERLIALAAQHGVPIHRDPNLVQVLAALDLEQEIPPSLYLVIAEVLAFLYAADEAWRAARRSRPRRAGGRRSQPFNDLPQVGQKAASPV